MKIVLIPIDGSDTSMQAVRQLLSLGSALKWVHAILLNVEPPVPLLERMVGGRPTEMRALQEPARAAGEKTLAPAKAEIERAGGRCTTHVEFGDPAETIASRAKEWNADVILMGMQAGGVTGARILGSVTRRVLQLAHVPVMLVK